MDSTRSRASIRGPTSAGRMLGSKERRREGCFAGSGRRHRVRAEEGPDRPDVDGIQPSIGQQAGHRMRIPFECERVFGRPVSAQFCVGSRRRPVRSPTKATPASSSALSSRSPSVSAPTQVRSAVGIWSLARPIATLNGPPPGVRWSGRPRTSTTSMSASPMTSALMNLCLSPRACLCRIDLTAAVMGSTVPGL